MSRCSLLLLVVALLGSGGCSEANSTGSAAAEPAGTLAPAESATQPLPMPLFKSGQRVWIDLPGGVFTRNKASGVLALQAIPAGVTVFRPSHAEGIVISVEGVMAKVQVTTVELLGESTRESAYIQAGAAPFIPVERLRPLEAGRERAEAAQVVYTYLLYDTFFFRDKISALMFAVDPITALKPLNPKALAEMFGLNEAVDAFAVLDAFAERKPGRAAAVLAIAGDRLSADPVARQVALATMVLNKRSYSPVVLVMAFNRSLFGTIVGVALGKAGVANLDPATYVGFGAGARIEGPKRGDGFTMYFLPEPDTLASRLEQRAELVAHLEQAFGAADLRRTAPSATLSEDEVIEHVAQHLRAGILYYTQNEVRDHPAADVYAGWQARIAALEAVIGRPFITLDDFEQARADLAAEAHLEKLRLQAQREAAEDRMYQRATDPYYDSSSSSQASNIVALAAYLAEYPTGRYAGKATARLAALKAAVEGERWKRVSEGAYQKGNGWYGFPTRPRSDVPRSPWFAQQQSMAWYLEHYPDGAHADEARERLADIERDKVAVATATERLKKGFVEAMKKGDTKTAQGLGVPQQFGGVRSWNETVGVADVIAVEQISFRWETPERAYLQVAYEGEERELMLGYDPERKQWRLATTWWE